MLHYLCGSRLHSSTASPGCPAVIRTQNSESKSPRHTSQVGPFFGRHTGCRLCVCPDYILKKITKKKCSEGIPLNVVRGRSEKKNKDMRRQFCLGSEHWAQERLIEMVRPHHKEQVSTGLKNHLHTSHITYSYLPGALQTPAETKQLHLIG